MWESEGDKAFKEKLERILREILAEGRIEIYGDVKIEVVDKLKFGGRRVPAAIFIESSVGIIRVDREARGIPITF